MLQNGDNEDSTVRGHLSCLRRVVTVFNPRGGLSDPCFADEDILLYCSVC